MPIDFLAGTATLPVAPRRPLPRVLVLDSGVGGLTVLREVRRARPDAVLVYAADDAAFPYGDWAEGPLLRRVEALVAELVERTGPDLVVVACNTISTLVLPTLRARFGLPFVGTVPAVKPAVRSSRTGRIAVLATPGTVRRDYTRGLVEAYSAGCAVDLVGSTRLAGFAEAELAREPVPDDVLLAEIAPCFSDRDGRRTDAVVLACTHYPLLLERLRAVAPWPVSWIDPSAAIARRVAQILGDAPAGAPSAPGPGLALFTGPGPESRALADALSGFGLSRCVRRVLPVEPGSRLAVDRGSVAA